MTNAQHFDAFIDNPALAGYDTVFIPLHHYFLQAMDRMWATLTTNAPLPPSQLVRTTPRGGAPGQAPAITAANLPPIAPAPAPAEPTEAGALEVVKAYHALLVAGDVERAVREHFHLDQILLETFEESHS